MRAYPVCVPCLINQGLNAIRRLGLGKDKEKEIALRVVKFLSQFEELERSPAYYAYFVQRIVKEIAGTEDPFYLQKRESNLKAIQMLPLIESLWESSSDRLASALKISAAGNYIDFAIKGEFEVEKEVKSILESEFTVWDYAALIESLNKSRTVLIIGDNAGEIVFDKILVRTLKEMGKAVIYGVKGKPILNDATLEDAEEVSMTEICRVVDNGSDKVGTWLEGCSKEFLDIFWSSDIVISKGQANFETLSGVGREMFFLLVAKCDPIASETGGKVKGLILKHKRL